jgi:hypothetical protein
VLRGRAAGHALSEIPSAVAWRRHHLLPILLPVLATRLPIPGKLKHPFKVSVSFEIKQAHSFKARLTNGHLRHELQSRSVQSGTRTPDDWRGLTSYLRDPLQYVGIPHPLRTACEDWLDEPADSRHRRVDIALLK